MPEPTTSRTHRALAGLRTTLVGSGAAELLLGLGGRWVLSGANALNALAQLHGTDKGSRAHGYARHYARYFRPLRFAPLTVLEIGVGGHEDPAQGGQSLRMWRDYFVRSKVIGADLHPKHLTKLGPRVEVVRCDQSDPASLAELARTHGPFDVVVDDGSHVGAHIRTSLVALLPHVRPGGWYVVEDLHTSFLASHHEPGDTTPIDVVVEATGAVHALDDVVQRGRVEAPATELEGIVAVHLHPGIAFFEVGAAPRRAAPR